MRWAAAALAFVLGACASGPSPDDPCYHDREALLALEYRAFDSNMERGWRDLAGRGCEADAVALLEAFRVERGTTPAQTMALVHSEAKLRATVGETRKAVRLLRTLLPINDTNPEMLAYHQAEIAFLTGDREGLQAARDRLASLPLPPSLAEAVALASENGNGADIEVRTPRLEEVDGFLNCFDKPYAKAVLSACRRGGN